MKKLVSFCLLLLLTVSLVENIVPPADAEIIDLNALMLSKFDDWMAYLTRRLSLNGTTSDTFDYSRVAQGHTTNVTLSFPSFLLALTHIYDGTNDEYYLRKLQAFMDGAIDNNLNYVNVTGVGQIFFPIAYYFGGSDRDTGTIYPGVFGYIATRLYLWTKLPRYKTIADRIASESYDKLAVIKNDTDIAWSWAYYQHRDETNAKMGVNRQTFFAWFYSLYGKEINSTFTGLVSKVVNWVWRAQLADGYLAYDIGGTMRNPWYTGLAVWATLNAFLVDSSSFSGALKDKIKNTVNMLDEDYNGQYSYQELYFLVPALLVASKTDYFASSITWLRAKSMLYVALRSMHFTEKGFVSRLDHYSFGFRWHQLSVVGLFTNYPLNDPLLDMSQFNPVTTYNYEVGKHKLNGWTGGIFAVDLRDGKNSYGSSIVHSNYRTLFFGPDGYQPPPSAISITNNTYYVRVESIYSIYTVDYYVYPSGVFVGDLKGTAAANIVLDNLESWRLKTANGTEWQITSFTNGSNYYIGTKFLIYLNDANPANIRSFFLESPTPNWRYTSLQSYLKLSFSQSQTNYRVILSEIESFGHLIQNASIAYNVLESLADAHDVPQPVSFETSFNAYHNKIAELEPDAPWNTVYKMAHSTPVKLIGHTLPEEVWIKSWDFYEDRLVFTVNTPEGKIGVIKIYVGGKGKPKSVSGAESWSYDNENNIVTINVLSSFSKEISAYWAEHNPPTTTISLSGVPGQNGWFTSDVTVSLNATDDFSGVDKTEYSLDNVTWITYLAPFTINNEGNATVYYKSIDKDGNEEATKAETIRIDKTDPSGSMLINNGSAYSTSHSVALTLTADDAVSGVFQVRFSDDGLWDTKPWENPSPAKAWALAGNQGTKTVYYQIRDKAGLLSDTYSDEIILDTEPPTGAITIEGGSTYTTSSSVNLILSAEDAISGVSLMRFSHDNVTWTPWETYTNSKSWALETADGTKTIYVQFMDASGQYSKSYKATIILDQTKPEVDADLDQTVNEDSVVTFNAEASQDENGIQSWVWAFTDSTTKTLIGEKQIYTFYTPGQYTITLNVTDMAGNWAIDTFIITVLDITKPIANAGNSQTVYEGVVVIFDASDSTDNVGITRYEWNFGDGTSALGIVVSHAFMISKNYTVTLTVKDAAGNTASHSVNTTILPAEIDETRVNAISVWILGSAILGTAVVIAVTVLYRKKNKREAKLLPNLTR